MKMQRALRMATAQLMSLECPDLGPGLRLVKRLVRWHLCGKIALRHQQEASVSRKPMILSAAKLLDLLELLVLLKLWALGLWVRDWLATQDPWVGSARALAIVGLWHWQGQKSSA